MGIPRRHVFESKEREPLQDNKKYFKDKLYSLVEKYLQDNKIVLNGIVSAEQVSKHLKTKVHYVKQVFHKMNLEGKMSKAIKDYGGMHSRYDPWGDCVCLWRANYYEIY